MNRMPTGQYMPGNSLIHRLDASVKLFSFIILLMAIILTDSILGYILITATALVVVWISGLKIKSTLGFIGRLWLFFIIIFLMNTFFFNTDNALWSWWIIHISFNGMIQGTNVVLRVALLMVFGNILTCATSPMEITAALESLLRPLKALRIPVEDVAMIISVAIQFIPTLTEETDTIKKAQMSRGAKFESSNLAERAVSVLPLVVPIFLSAFRRADELSVAMEARGYRGGGCRTKKKTALLRLSDAVAVIASIGICAVQIFVFT